MQEPSFHRDMGMYKKDCHALAQMCHTDAMGLAQKCAPLGQGAYNTQLLVKDIAVPGEFVLRVSFYSAHTINQVLKLLKHADNKNSADARIRFVMEFDIVQIKNNFSRVGNIMIQEHVCPHFVFMYYQRDVKGFAGEVEANGVQFPDSKHKNASCFRYNNISLHEKFEGSLRTKMKTITEKDLIYVVFQITYAIYCMQYYLPRFRHNDTSIDNILISSKKWRRNSSNSTLNSSGSLTYTVLGQRFTLPSSCTFAALTDYDLSHAPCRVRIGSTRKYINLMNAFMVRDLFANHSDQQARLLTADFNPSCDMYYFLYRLREAIVKFGRSSQMPRVLTYINDHIPSSTARYPASIVDDLVPLAMLQKATLFSAFRKKESGRMPDATYKIKCLPMRVVTYADEGRVCAEKLEASVAINAHEASATEHVATISSKQRPSQVSQTN